MSYCINRAVSISSDPSHPDPSHPRRRHTLTLGYDFTDTELTLVDPPEWVRSIGKDENGNIVLDVKTNGTVIILQ